MANDEQQELREEGWQAHDLRSGVAKVFADAKDRSTLGIRVVAVWAVLIFIFGTLDMAGASSVAPPLWDIAVGFTAIMLSALAVSRTPGPMLAAVAVIFLDVAGVSYRLPELLDHGTLLDHGLLLIRVLAAPVAMFLALGGYFGALSIQAFKKGFSPGTDWRTRMNPRMMQLVVVGSCMGALVLGLAVWVGAIAGGFAQTDVVWLSNILFTAPVKMDVGKPAVEKAKDERKEAGLRVDLNVLEHQDKKEPEVEARVVYPEAAKPITSTAGLDEFAKGEIEDAYDFASETDDYGCLVEGQGRQDRCRDDRCRYWARIFERACLAKAKKTEHFCDEVPDPTFPTPGETWAQARCAGRNFDYCRELLYAVQGHCHPPDKKDAKATLSDAKTVLTPVQPAAPAAPADQPPAGGGQAAK